jgi:hypothetical protein
LDKSKWKKLKSAKEEKVGSLVEDLLEEDPKAGSALSTPS